MPMRPPTAPRRLDGRTPYPSGSAGGAAGAHDSFAEIQAGVASATAPAVQVPMGSPKQGGIYALRSRKGFHRRHTLGHTCCRAAVDAGITPFPSTQGRG